MERLKFTFEVDWDQARERVLALYHGDPATFSPEDFELLTRALWKSDRTGLYWGGVEALHRGLLAKMVRHWDGLCR